LFLPVLYSFTAGIVTMVSPCSVALLPSYMSLYLLGSENQPISRAHQVVRAIYRSVIAVSGFSILSIAVGALAGITGEFILRVVPWFAFVVAVFLLGIGGFVLSGRQVSIVWFSRLAGSIPGYRRNSVIGFFLFGVAYSFAAISCTLPVYLVVVVGAFASRGIATGLILFASYALGMLTVLCTVALVTTFVGQLLGKWLPKLTPLVNRISGGLLVLSGGYLIYYWISTGNVFGIP